jgi:hypothetical protein
MQMQEYDEAAESNPEVRADDAVISADRAWISRHEIFTASLRPQKRINGLLNELSPPV